MKRVMHIVAELGAGGVEKQLVKALTTFDRNKVSNAVCCISRGGIYEQELRDNQIPYTIIKRRGRFDISVVQQIANLLRRERIDIVHTYNFTANTWGRLAAWYARIPRIIAHERGTAWTENSAMRQIDRLLYPSTDIVLANSEASRLMLTQKIRLSPERIRVVYNGIPFPKDPSTEKASLRGRLGISKDTPLIVAVGRLDTPKGHYFLIKAVPFIWQEYPEAHVAIIGNGPLFQNLKIEAQGLNLFKNDLFHMLGFLQNPEGYFPEIDLIVHPSIRESLGNVLIEASMSGLPAVASNVDGIPEVVSDKQTGLLIDGTQAVQYIPAKGASPMPEVVVDGSSRQLRPPRGPAPEDLAKSIIQLLRNPSLRKNMGDKGRARARQLFSLEQYVRTLEEIYQV